MIWYLIELFVDTVEALIIIKFCSVYKKRYKSTIAYYIGGFSITAIIFIFNYFSYDLDCNFRGSFVGMLIIIFIVVLALYDEKIIKLLLGYIGLLILIVAIEGIILSVLSFIFGESPAVFAKSNILRVLGMVVSKLITFFVVVLFISDGERFGLRFSKKSLLMEIITLFVINLGIMISIVPMYRNLIYENNEDSIVAGFVILGLGIVNIVSLLIYDKLLAQSKKDLELQLKIQQYEMQSKYFDEINNATLKLKSLRHDMSNHLGNIKGLLRYKEYTKLEEYLNKLLSQIDEIDKIIITKYPAISALLNRKYARAVENNINCVMNIGSIDNLTIDIVDICIILGNLIDNAIEATIKVNENNRYIKLDINNVNNYLVIDCVNNTIGSENISLDTTKADKEIHGIGLMNINQIVEKYYGNMEIMCIKDYFNVNIMLYNGELN
ncbi:sensor histidine kinase [Vallitalea sp.]|jgi:sensor histidine kinase YesM|uniref:sensor histidine kinase n=1 Tax=Vallitalea sp. TaxID=1882829 RepID=UPI0025CBE694|nr:sensor histidine kinase [Vallitalea sp.]MCT4688656.1 GHKL domain-containing protein [Vallitalea sp.]